MKAYGAMCSWKVAKSWAKAILPCLRKVDSPRPPTSLDGRGGTRTRGTQFAAGIPCMKQRVVRPAIPAVTPSKKRGFCSANATFGGGHIPVPGAALEGSEFHASGFAARGCELA